MKNIDEEWRMQMKNKEYISKMKNIADEWRIEKKNRWRVKNNDEDLKFRRRWKNTDAEWRIEMKNEEYTAC